MTQLVFGVVLKGDGTGLVSTARTSQAAVDGLKGSINTASAETRKLTADTGSNAAELRRQAGEAQRSAEATGRLSAASRAAAAAQREATAAARSAQFGMRNLGYQISDVGVQVASGTNAFLIFGQQAAQVTAAMADMGGKVGLLGRALSGPLGAAFLSIVAIAGVFGSKLLEASSAAELAKEGSNGLAEAQSSLGQIFDLTSGKIDKQNALLVANARLTAINLREEARRGRESAGRTIDSTGNGDFMSAARALMSGGISGVQALGTKQYSAFTQLNNIRLAANDGERQKAVQKALSFSETADFKGMDVTADQFRQAVIDLAAAAAKEVTAGEIDKALDTGTLPASLKKDKRPEKPKSLDGTLGSVLKDLDPLASIQNEYSVRLKNIEKLAKAKLISDTAADQLRIEAERAMRDARIKLDEDVAKRYQQGLDRASSEAFKDMVNGPIKLVGQSLEQQGEMIGKGVAKSLAKTLPIVENAFGKTLSALGAGNKLSGLGERLVGGKSFDIGFGSFKADLKSTFKQIFSLDGDFGKLFKSLGETIGQIGAAASLGADLGGLIGGGSKGGKIGGAIGGVLGKEIGKLIGPEIGKAVGGQLGKVLGGAAGPLGAIAGSLIGGALGGLFKTTKKGTATLGAVDGQADIVGTGGNNASRISNAKKLGGGVTDALQSIIDQLGGTLGNFSVSIGQRNKKFVVDSSGGGKTKGYGTQSFSDEQDAAIAALADAIADGAVQGLSAAVTKALKSDSDVEDALKEALKVQQVEDLLGGLGAQLQREFKSFEQQAADRLRIAKKYGFDLVKLEEVNAKERAAIFDRVLEGRIEPLKNLLADLSTGDLSEGTAVDKRNALLEAAAKAKGQAEEGVDGAAATYADLRRRLLELDRGSFGTAGSEYKDDRATTKTELERIIALETERAKLAQQAAQEALQAAKATATGVDETNDLLAQQNRLLQDIAAAFNISGIGAIGQAAGYGARSI